MNPVVASIIVAATTTLGRWARGKHLDVDIVIGLVGIAIGLSIIDQMNKELAKAFAALAVVATLFAHADVIFKIVGGSSASTNGGGGGGIQPDFH